MTLISEHIETDTRERILVVAERLFRQIGYQKTTVADIAKELRMSPANVYRFFESKKAIHQSVARSLMGEPSLLLCDEPTGNLDSKSAANVLDILGGLSRSGLTLVVITHDESVAARADRRVRIVDGTLGEVESAAAGRA